MPSGARHLRWNRRTTSPMRQRAVRELSLISSERPRKNRVWRPSENLVSCNRIAKDRVHQNAAAVGRQQNQNLAFDFPHLDDVFPPQPAASSAEERQKLVLIEHAVVADVNMVAVLHRRRGQGAEEEENEAGEREEVDFAPSLREILEQQRRRSERRRA